MKKGSVFVVSRLVCVWCGGHHTNVQGSWVLPLSLNF